MVCRGIFHYATEVSILVEWQDLVLHSPKTVSLGTVDIAFQYIKAAETKLYPRT